MGLEKAKSLLTVKDGKTFLDLIAEQVRISQSKRMSDRVFVALKLEWFVSVHGQSKLAGWRGLEKGKSLLTLKDGKTFLDLIAEQVG
jgi:UDP-N-acetylglucosamine pyrophosphorylase